MSLSKITTTVGLNIGTVDVGKARLMFWDLGGQEELQSLWDKYYAECHGVIYVVDSTDEERLAESEGAFDLPHHPRHQDCLWCLRFQDRAAGLPDPGLFRAHRQRGERGHRVDGEVRRAQRAPAAAAEGHHVDAAHTLVGHLVLKAGPLLAGSWAPHSLGFGVWSASFSLLSLIAFFSSKVHFFLCPEKHRCLGSPALGNWESRTGAGFCSVGS
ncbi:ADP-ribosylation factor-related protein 1 isoform X2 [Tamandua tetradactyla]